MVSLFQLSKRISTGLCIVFIISIFFALFICHQIAGAEEKKPIYVQFFTHQQHTPIRNIGDAPTPYSRYAKELIDIWEKYGIKGEYTTLGINAQTLLEDFPETVEKIKRMKIPVCLYHGVGHAEPNPVGRMPEIEEMDWEEQVKTVWNFESHTLIPSWHLSEGKLVLGNPRQGRPISFNELSNYNLPSKRERLAGGVLAVQMTFGVTPLIDISPFTNLNRKTGRDNPVFRALGIGSFEQSYYDDKPITSIPSTHSLPHGIEGYRFLANNFPRDRAMYIIIGVGMGNTTGEEYIKYFLNNPEDFKIIWPDPEGRQWESENSPLEFYRKTYGVNSLYDVIEMDCPVDKILAMSPGIRRETAFAGYRMSKRNVEILPWEERTYEYNYQKRNPEFLQPKTKVIVAGQLLEGADYLLTNWPQPSHSGDFGAPPYYVKTKQGNLSLSEIFQALVCVLREYTRSEELPSEVLVKEILGPIDFPMYDIKEKPRRDPRKEIGGYLANELPEEFFPTREEILTQGLVGDPQRAWWPQRSIVNQVNLLHTACQVWEFMEKEGHIPGVIEMYIREENKTRDTKAIVNPAEFLYAMAQEIRVIHNKGIAGRVFVVSLKIFDDQICDYLMPATSVGMFGGHLASDRTRFNGFVWREKISRWILNKAWNYKPE